MSPAGVNGTKKIPDTDSLPWKIKAVAQTKKKNTLQRNLKGRTDSTNFHPNSYHRTYPHTDISICISTYIQSINKWLQHAYWKPNLKSKITTTVYVFWNLLLLSCIIFPTPLPSSPSPSTFLHVLNLSSLLRSCLYFSHPR